MTRRTMASVGLGCLVLTACGTPPPRPWLRFQPAGPTTWTASAEDQLVGRLHGADVAIDLGRQQTRVEIVVQNTTAQALEFRIGPAGAAPRNAIGQVLLRRLDGPPGAGSPDYVPYNGMQPLMVEAGWRATMYIDAPLGRDPQLGQYFVLTVEARDATGACERHLLPLTASNAGTMPADGR